MLQDIHIIFNAKTNMTQKNVLFYYTAHYCCQLVETRVSTMRACVGACACVRGSACVGACVCVRACAHVRTCVCEFVRMIIISPYLLSHWLVCEYGFHSYYLHNHPPD